MKVENARDCYYESTARASDIVRQLALAGIAVVWIFRTGDQKTFLFPSHLFYALDGFCITLALDLLQYLSKSLMWGLFHRHKEKELMAQGIDPAGNNPAAEFKVPHWFNWPATALFWGKCTALCAAAFFMYQHLASVIVGKI